MNFPNKHGMSAANPVIYIISTRCDFFAVGKKQPASKLVKLFALANRCLNRLPQIQVSDTFRTLITAATETVTAV